MKGEDLRGKETREDETIPALCHRLVAVVDLGLAILLLFFLACKRVCARNFFDGSSGGGAGRTEAILTTVLTILMTAWMSSS